MFDRKNRIIGFIRERLIINPYYFVLLFFGLCGLNCHHAVCAHKDAPFPPIYFLLYGVGQSLLEVLVLAFIANIIRKYLPKAFYLLFIVLSGLCLVMHYLDFLCMRVVDHSLFYVIDVAFDETLDNLVELISLTEMSPLFIIASFVTVFIFIPVAVVIIYRVTARWRKRPLQASHGHLLRGLLLVPLALFALDLTFSPLLNVEELRFYRRILPWKSTFLAPKSRFLTIPGTWKEFPPEREALRAVETLPLAPLEKKPNIYLFIAESLREDYLTDETAPHLTRFREDCMPAGKTLSNANCTHLSWYAIFHSEYPMWWAKKKERWKSGSIPLRIFKKLGYNIRLYSAAQLKYYGLEELIFGKDRQLADSCKIHTHYVPVTAAVTDGRVTDHLIADHDQEWAKEGNLFLIFLDSTHFNYSWPEGEFSKFLPVATENVRLIGSLSPEEVEPVKNRYRNAIAYVDSLFGRFVRRLREKGVYDDACILFTGDHGEEFMEEGRLFHASHLSRMQTSPPIYYKPGSGMSGDRKSEVTLSSHVDIFPTLFDLLTGRELLPELFDGESLFRSNRFPFTVSGRQNWGRNPHEFFFHTGEEKVTLRHLPGKKGVGQAVLRIIALKDANDKSKNPKELESYILNRYGRAFDRFFTEP